MIKMDAGDIVLTGFEKGVAASPLSGIGAIKNANISSQPGEVMCNFPRVAQYPTTGAGTLTFSSSGGGPDVFSLPLTPVIAVGNWLTIGAGITGLSAGTYYVLSRAIVSTEQHLTLSATYNGAGTTGASAGSASFTIFTMTNAPVSGDAETYFDGSVLQYRYYIADAGGYVWVYDTALALTYWTIIDTNAKTGISSIKVYNGHLHVFSSGFGINYKLTAILGQNPESPGNNNYGTSAMINYLNAPTNAYPSNHVAFVGQGGLFYGDANFVVSVIHDSTSSALNANVFSYGKFTASGATITVNPLFAGAFPVVGQTIVFFSDTTLYTGVNSTTVYYVIATNYSALSATFEVSSSVGGSAVSFSGGAGKQYFNSWSPKFGTINGAVIGGTGSTYVGTPQACTLPFDESVTALTEANTNLVIGTNGNNLYFWDEGAGASNDISPQSRIPMAERNCKFLLTVNNIIFDFRGSKGNIYVTSGAAASIVLKVPDYLAGVPGSESSYIEPYFTWGQAFFARGRVFFSLQDQTASKAGNCGGIYSFVPSFYNSVTGQDIGTALRLENYNSYKTYNGLATVLVPALNQTAIGIQFYSGWTSSLSTPTYGIDTTGSFPTEPATIECDLIPTGNILGKQKLTFNNVEYKLAAPLIAGESVTLNYRIDGTGTWNSAGTVQTEGATEVAGYISPIAFDNTQWLQIQAILTPNGTSNYSGNRLTEIRLRADGI